MPDAQLRADMLGLSDVLKSLRDEVSDLKNQRAGENNNSRSNITINAGGAAVWIVAWIAGLSCAFMLGAVLVGGFLMQDNATRAAQERAELRSSINANKAYLSAIYQVAPQLKPKTQEEKQ